MVAAGSPEDVAKVSRSYTGRYLKDVFAIARTGRRSPPRLTPRSKPKAAPKKKTPKKAAPKKAAPKKVAPKKKTTRKTARD